MSGYRIFDHLLERLTFGLRIHYLLKVLIFQFAALFVTYQFARPLSISIDNQPIFVASYGSISVILVIVVFAFVHNMSERTFNTSLYGYWSSLLSVTIYLIVSSIIVISGFISLIVASSGFSEITLLDIIAGAFFVSVFTSLLAVGYHDKLEEVDHPTQSQIRDCISDWENHIDWASLPEGSQEKNQAREEFEKSCREIVELLENAKTVRGINLYQDFSNWLNKYDTHENPGKEMIIRGQDKDELKNEQLAKERKEFMTLRKKLNSLSPHSND